MPVRMELNKIIISELADQQVIVLREIDGERTFPIVIGTGEAVAISRRLKGDVPARPMTHELLADVIDKLGGEVTRVEITDLQQHTFFARIHIRRADGEEISIDSRPSDAIAIGIATQVPIDVNESVLSEVC
ncbi:MAG: bifunctional nuclease family protein [Planctomycetota bacterium]